MRVSSRNERKSTIYRSEIERHVRVQLLANRDEYQLEDGTLDEKKLADNVRKILGLHGEGWDSHSKYYQVEFNMICPVIYQVKQELGIN